MDSSNIKLGGHLNNLSEGGDQNCGLFEKQEYQRSKYQ